MTQQQNTQLASTFKSADTEEWLDIHFTRPLGLLWAKFFNHFDIHPNVVTILSIILGAAAGVMFYFTDLTHTIIGILLLVWANLYDSADGQLARMTGKKTRWGVFWMVLPVTFGSLRFMQPFVCVCREIVFLLLR